MMAALTLYVAGPILYCVPTGLIYAGKGGTRNQDGRMLEMCGRGVLRVWKH